MAYQAPTKGFFSDRLTKYEKTLVIGTRIEQLVYGAPTLLSEEEIKSCSTFKEIAELELKNKVIPFKISRTMPNNEVETRSIQNMIVFD